jgi:anhydro-N-acetylmuramic acid kinase
MKRMAVGIMSGTSLDGIDVCLAQVEGTSKETQVEILAFETYPMEDNLKGLIKEAMHPSTCTPALMSSLNMMLGYTFGDAVVKLCSSYGIQSEELDFVASHGQTIWHINEDDGLYVKSSLQLGDGAAIAAKVKTTVITNFRTADIAAGGVGAPLVPYVDYLLFSDDHKHRSLHNLGGISNMTVLQKGGREEDMIAFDTGPANLMMDRAMMVLYGKAYDQDGQIASSGKKIPELHRLLMSHPYLNEKPPKSTGRELFGDAYTDEILHLFQHEKKEDIMYTLTMFTKDSIVKAYQDFILNHIKLDEIIFSGGGAYNQFLLEEMKKSMPDINILKLEDIGFDSKAKEALAFLILGNETINHKPSNLLKATGAKRKAILGQIQYYLK